MMTFASPQLDSVDWRSAVQVRCHPPVLSLSPLQYIEQHCILYEIISHPPHNRVKGQKDDGQLPLLPLLDMIGFISSMGRAISAPPGHKVHDPLSMRHTVP